MGNDGVSFTKSPAQIRLTNNFLNTTVTADGSVLETELISAFCSLSDGTCIKILNENKTRGNLAHYFTGSRLFFAKCFPLIKSM